MTGVFKVMKAIVCIVEAGNSSDVVAELLGGFGVDLNIQIAANLALRVFPPLHL